ncbi:unnamed protein product [Caretta caretta]
MHCSTQQCLPPGRSRGQPRSPRAPAAPSVTPLRGWVPVTPVLGRNLVARGDGCFTAARLNGEEGKVPASGAGVEGSAVRAVAPTRGSGAKEGRGIPVGKRALIKKEKN